VHRDNNCCLVTKDFHILEAMLAERSGQNDPLVPLLRAKLSRARVLPPHEIPPGVVTLYSRVRYSVDRRPATTRILVLGPAHEIVGGTLPITRPSGLALLGLAEGAVLTVQDAAGLPQTLAIEKILYQPEAAGRAAAPDNARYIH
jgi:transcription elongation GreA/GreB family factor